LSTVIRQDVVMCCSAAFIVLYRPRPHNCHRVTVQQPWPWPNFWTIISSSNAARVAQYRHHLPVIS